MRTIGHCGANFMAKFRILSLDGGGPWALIQVRALQELYGKATTGHEVLRDFDLVAANSGGSFTLGGLIENFTLQDLPSIFFLSKTKRKAVFSPVSFWEQVRNAQYDLPASRRRARRARLRRRLWSVPWTLPKRF